MTPRLVKASLKACTSLVLKGGAEPSVGREEYHAQAARAKRRSPRETFKMSRFITIAAVSVALFLSQPAAFAQGAGEHWVAPGLRLW